MKIVIEGAVTQNWSGSQRRLTGESRGEEQEMPMSLFPSVGSCYPTIQPSNHAFLHFRCVMFYQSQVGVTLFLFVGLCHTAMPFSTFRNIIGLTWYAEFQGFSWWACRWMVCGVDFMWWAERLSILPHFLLLAQECSWATGSSRQGDRDMFSPWNMCNGQEKTNWDMCNRAIVQRWFRTTEARPTLLAVFDCFWKPCSFTADSIDMKSLFGNHHSDQI